MTSRSKNYKDGIKNYDFLSILLSRVVVRGHGPERNSVNSSFLLKYCKYGARWEGIYHDHAKPPVILFLDSMLICYQICEIDMLDS